MPDEDSEMFIPNTSVVSEHVPPPIVHLIPGKTDTELAAEFKKRLAEAYSPVLILFDEVKAAGFDCAISAGVGPLGKHNITMLRVIKEF